MILVFIAFLAGALSLQPHHRSASPHGVYFNDEIVDIHMDRNLHAPSNLRIRRVDILDPDVPKQYLVHVQPPITDGLRNSIERVTGSKLVVYIPHNTYVVHADAEMVEKLQAIPNVLWVGEYQPQYKVDSAIRQLTSLDEPVRKLFAMLLPVDPPREQEELSAISVELSVLLQGAGIAPVQVSVVSNEKIAVELNSADVASAADVLASSHDVHFVELARTHKAFNKFARATVQSGVSGVTPFTGDGINGEGEIVGVADTGTY